MKKTYSINEICKLTKVSVRTLHHYDEINLLKPKNRTEKRHRRYTEEDLQKLQQIVTLKFMGFSLSDIKNILNQKDFNFFDSLKIQEKALLEKIDLLKKINKFINYLITQNELNQPTNWATIIQIIEVLKSSNTDHQQWYEKYLTDPEQKQFDHHGEKHMVKWQTLFEKAKQNCNSGFDDRRDIEFVEQLLTMANEFYGNQPNLVNKLWEAFKVGIIPNQLDNDKKVIAYITQSFEKMKKYKEAIG